MFNIGEMEGGAVMRYLKRQNCRCLKAKCCRNGNWAGLVVLTEDSFMIAISNKARKLVVTEYGGA